MKSDIWPREKTTSQITFLLLMLKKAGDERVPVLRYGIQMRKPVMDFYLASDGLSSCSFYPHPSH